MNETAGEIADFVRRHEGDFRQELFEFLRIPSVSTESRYRDEVRRCAEFTAERLRASGIGEVEIIPTGGHPIVLGHHHAGDDVPTLLVYGHYDVQPVDPLDLWESPPFEPEVRDGRVYARGSTDNKGQVHMHMKALETCMAVRDDLPLNVTLVVEGEEEVGSIHLGEFLRRSEDRLTCDAILLSDTLMFARDLPTVITGLRGLVYFEMIVRGPSTDLHSGMYGGPVVNPANAAAGIVAALEDGKGRVTVPAFYDDVRPADDDERHDLQRLPFDADDLLREVGAPALGGEPGYTPLELIRHRPSLDVNGMRSGFTGEGAKTVLPSTATVKVSMRLVPDQDPGKISEAFEEYVRDLTPQGVTVELRELHRGAPWAERPEGPLADAASEVLTDVFGNPPVYVREGGSIPIIPLLAETFRVPVLPIGFGLPGCNLHAPNEWLDLEVYRRGVEALARLYARMGELDF